MCRHSLFSLQGFIRVFHHRARLRLSFSRNGKRLYCDQHDGKWIMQQECSTAVERLVGQWGGLRGGMFLLPELFRSRW